VTDEQPRVLYVLSTFPFGNGEPFVQPELDWLSDGRATVFLVPVRPRGPQRFVAHLAVVSGRLFGWAVVRSALGELGRQPLTTLRAVVRVLRAGSLRHKLKNLAVVPKALWIGSVARSLGISHIHAYWASTPATVAMIAGEVTGIPWSFTGHRWDLVDANILKEKIAAASFGRVISEDGVRRTVELLRGEHPPNLVMAHLGIEVPPPPTQRMPSSGTMVVLCPALLIERKDHDTLFRAFALMTQNHEIDADLWLAGSGPRRRHLESLAVELGIEAHVRFLGQLDRQALLDIYDRGEADLVVLTSIDEGIPVALMEAMARRIPVIGTDVGGISELLADGGGLLVAPGRPDDVAIALWRLAVDHQRRAEVGSAGRRTIETQFACDSQMPPLLERFRA
jgi:glycosyltransferase involved in cell wall biosynthesis